MLLLFSIALKKNPRSAALDIYNMIDCPIKLFLGITIPVCSIELGLKYKDNLTKYVECLSNILVELAYWGT